MIDGLKTEHDAELGTLAFEVGVRVLNCGGSGCLIETRRALPVGSVGVLQLAFATGTFDETVQVVRCQEIAGASGVFHVGTEFLGTTPLSTESLRYLFRREAASVGASLRLAPQR